MNILLTGHSGFIDKNLLIIIKRQKNIKYYVYQDQMIKLLKKKIFFI